MIELISVPTILGRPKYYGGAWLSTRLWWQREEDVALAALSEAGADIEKCAAGLGRSPSSLAHRASDTGLKLPRTWRELISKKRPSRKIELPVQYPYIRNVTGEHAELLEVNSLIPIGLPDYVRADVCQEIMLALWEKKVSIEELRADSKIIGAFLRKFRRDNYEAGGHALSLDAPLGDGRSWYNILPVASSGPD